MTNYSFMHKTWTNSHKVPKRALKLINENGLVNRYCFSYIYQQKHFKEIVTGMVHELTMYGRLK